MTSMALEAIGAEVDRRACGPRGANALAELLHEGHPFYAGLSAGEVERMRAYVFAQFARTGFTAEAEASARDELASSFSPRILAGIAKSVVGLDGSSKDFWLGLIEGARRRISGRDERISLETITAQPCCAAQTADQALAAAACALQEAAPLVPGDCSDTAEPVPFTLVPSMLAGTVLEDQDGGTHRLDDLVRDGGALIGFFYTRCMNPLKCAATVRLLGKVAEVASLEARPFRTIGISYDGPFDVPERLLRFGHDHGYNFGPNAVLTRCREGWEALDRSIRLRVNYGGVTVNVHAVELFFLGADMTGICLPDGNRYDPIVLTRQLFAAAAVSRLSS